MPSTINASNGLNSGLISTGDTSGELQLQVNNGTPAVTLNTSGAIGVGSTPAYGSSGQVLTSNGSSAAPTWANGLSLSGDNTWTGTQSFTGTSSKLAVILNDAGEVCTVSATAATGTINYDITTQSVLFYTTNASGNWTINLRASSGTTLNTIMSTGQSVTCAFLVTNGATAYYNTTVQVDGTVSGVTTRWQGGAAPTQGNASSVDVYAYTIIKTANATFSVFASQTRFA